MSGYLIFIRLATNLHVRHVLASCTRCLPIFSGVSCIVYPYIVYPYIGPSYCGHTASQLRQRESIILCIAIAYEVNTKLGSYLLYVPLSQFVSHCDLGCVASKHVRCPAVLAISWRTNHRLIGLRLNSRLRITNRYFMASRNKKVRKKKKDGLINQSSAVVALQ